MDKLIVVSVDAHAQIPPDAWADYLEPTYHEHLASLREEHERFREIFGGLVLERIYCDPEVFDTEGAYGAGGAAGLYDLDVRLGQMDREGVAADFLIFGDPRYVSMFFANSNRRYPLEVRSAGVRAWHRWVHDTFGGVPDRFFPVGLLGCAPCLDMDETLEELDWIADHGFVGTLVPGFTDHPDLPPLSDDYWEPFWARCEERRIGLFVHAGYGHEQGPFADEVEVLHQEIAAAGGVTEELLERRNQEIVANKFFSTLQARRPLWQILLGGVFDRHPDLRLVMTEVRADWIPAMLGHLDAVHAEHRSELRAQRTPSEYWASNCLTSVSFVHRAEVEMRDEIGVDTMAFGTDFPHSEGTWPNTKQWLADAFVGVTEEDLRRILGENVIRFFGLDRARLAEIAARIGPTVDEILARGPASPALVEHFDRRGGYLKPAERDSQLAAVDSMLRDDLRPGAPLLRA